jgi:2-polyprenyl-3-methyl-5-hydroxy-6-metoxy-1,4-benzoquinol methylase
MTTAMTTSTTMTAGAGAAPQASAAPHPTVCALCGASPPRLRFQLDGFDTVECARCGLVWIVLQMSEEELKRLYGAEYFQERGSYFFDNAVADPGKGEETEVIRDFRRGIDRIERFRKPGKLLDVGCGVGVFLGVAKSRGWDVTGVDVSEYASGYAREKLGLDARTGKLDEVGLAEKSFDVITLWDVFEHFPDPVRQLREVRRLLKDDGVILLDTPNERGLLRELSRWIYKLSFGAIQYPAKKLHHVYHLFYYSPATLAGMLQKAGFEVIDFEKKVIPPLKARGSALEKALVGAFGSVERKLGREFELLLIARKVAETEARDGAAAIAVERRA